MDDQSIQVSNYLNMSTHSLKPYITNYNQKYQTVSLIKVTKPRKRNQKSSKSSSKRNGKYADFLQKFKKKIAKKESTADKKGRNLALIAKIKANLKRKRQNTAKINEKLSSLSQPKKRFEEDHEEFTTEFEYPTIINLH